VKYSPLLQLFSMIKSEDGINRRGDFFWSVGDFSFEKDTTGHISTGQYYGLQLHYDKRNIFVVVCDTDITQRLRFYVYVKVRNIHMWYSLFQVRSDR